MCLALDRETCGVPSKRDDGLLRAMAYPASPKRRGLPAISRWSIVGPATGDFDAGTKVVAITGRAEPAWKAAPAAQSALPSAWLDIDRSRAWRARDRQQSVRCARRDRCTLIIKDTSQNGTQRLSDNSPYLANFKFGLRRHSAQMRHAKWLRVVWHSGHPTRVREHLSGTQSMRQLGRR